MNDDENNSEHIASEKLDSEFRALLHEQPWVVPAWFWEVPADKERTQRILKRAFEEIDSSCDASERVSNWVRLLSCPIQRLEAAILSGPEEHNSRTEWRMAVPPETSPEAWWLEYVRIDRQIAGSGNIRYQARVSVKPDMIASVFPLKVALVTAESERVIVTLTENGKPKTTKESIPSSFDEISVEIAHGCK